MGHTSSPPPPTTTQRFLDDAEPGSYRCNVTTLQRASVACIHKLNYYSVSGSIDTWIEDFLIERTLQVAANGATSSSAIVTSCVPQGTDIGPLLFLLYIYTLIYTIILLKYVCLSAFANSRSQFLLDRLWKCL